jgi:23S rRNA pseudouridine2605 synthase
MRLNVYLQQAGVGSRREAERLVAAGRVQVNGRTAEPTTPVEEGDEVRVDGHRVAPATRALPRLFRLYKPLDVLVTGRDDEGRTTIYDLPALQDRRLPRLMYVGRLDVNSEGLLLLSADGPLAQALMSPANALERVYRARVHGRLTSEQLHELARGITIDGIRYRGAKVSEERAPAGRNTWYRVVLTEGKNREVRRLLEHFGCVVNRLIRVQYGPFALGDLREGELLEVPAKEVRKLLERLGAGAAKSGAEG